MAKELDTELSKADVSETVVKPDKKKEKSDKKPHTAKKSKKSVAKFFREAKSEFKKVSWPTPKQVVNNTSVVLIMIIGSMLAIWGLDSLLLAVLRFAFKMN